MAITGNVQVTVNLTETGATGALETPSSSLSKQYPWNIVSGTGTSQSDMKYAATRTIAASGNEDLDLAGILIGILGGSALTFVKLRLALFKAADANPANLTIINKATNFAPLFNSASSGIILEPGALFMYESRLSGKAIVAATADLLNVAAGAGGSHSYDVIFVGTSA